jgi:WD40 repeat protein
MFQEYLMTLDDAGDLQGLDVKRIVHKALTKQNLTEQRQQDNARNAFAVVLGSRRSLEAATKQAAREANGLCRARICTGLLIVGSDVLALVSTFIARAKVELRREWKAGETVVESCRFSPCGNLISVCSGNDVSIWHADGAPESCARLKCTLKGHTDGVSDCRFFPRTSTRAASAVVSASDDGTLKVWDIDAGSLDRTLEGHTGDVNCVDISPDGTTILSGSVDDSAKLWNVTTGELKHTVRTYSALFSCSFSPNGGLFLVGCRDSSLKLYDSKTCRLQRTFAGHNAQVFSCSFAPDGAAILSGSPDATMKLWCTATGQLLRTLEGHCDDVWSCAFSPTGLTIVSISLDSTLRLWTATTGRLQQIIELQNDKGTSCCFSPDGKSILGGCFDGAMEVWSSLERSGF